MTDADELQTSLLRARNADGGWPYRAGRSWTEPTSLSLIALWAGNTSSESCSIAACWLANHQGTDGGWPPCANVSTSTWVTSLVLIALAQESQHSQSCAKAIRWVSSHVYPESSGLQAFLQKKLGLSPSHAPGSSPWFPGTAGWVIPTAFSILALSSWSRRFPSADLQPVVDRAQTYLLSRRCPDGGWNHGGSLQRSEASTSYPETTGLALLALAGSTSPTLGPTLRLAETFLSHPESSEGLAWLSMGLAAHGHKVEETQFTIRPKTTRETALQLIALHALRHKNPFLQPAS
jgi:hypothetical protein